ncbi:MAG: hypothetical protein ABW137_10450 [Mycobacterium sp.]
MTTPNTKTNFAAPFDVDLDATADRIRGLNDKLMAAAKQTGAVSLDTYEQAVNTVLDFGQKAADSTKVEWVSALARSQASIVSEVTTTYANAARDLLK